MKHAFFANLLMILRTSGHIGLALSRKMFARFKRMTLPQMLLAAVALVIAVAALHLALFLFIVFMVFKLIVAFTFFQGRGQFSKPVQQAARQPHYRRYPHAQGPNKQGRNSEPYTIDM